MVSTILKRIVMCAALAACTLGVSGCSASRSYEVPATAEQADEARRDAESRLKEQEKEKAARLQKDLDAAKNEARNERVARMAAEARIKKLEQENADLRKRIPKADSSNKTFTPEFK